MLKSKNCKDSNMAGNIDYDHAVIGAGINGSWTALHLSKKGCKTVLIEQFPLPHNRGSSQGQTRIIRRAYNKKFLRDMMEDAYQQWRWLESMNGTKLLKQVGLLFFGTKDSDFLKEVLEGYHNDCSGEHELFEDPEEFTRLFPLIKSENRFRGCMDKESGLLMADQALAATIKTAANFGCKIEDGFLITDVVPQKEQNTVKITGKKDGIEKTLVTKGLVLCCGPWSNQLLTKLEMPLPLQPQKIPVYYWKFSEMFSHNLVFKTKTLAIYGTPEHEYPGLVKICHHGGPETDPNFRDAVDTSEIKKKVSDFIRDHLPTVEPDPKIEESCIYTVTPDWNHILDKHPKFPNIIIGAGFSGSGFKLGPVTGEILADLTLGREPKYSLEPFRASRFKNKLK